jgi:hypothetical protein
MMAAKWTSQFYRTQAQYGTTFTLNDALQQKKLDCVRATDMIGAVFRNAGRPRFGNVRWCGGTYAHSVAAFLTVGDDDKPRTLLADALDPKDQPELWPACYFKGHAWPPGLESAAGGAKPYSAELYVRGLDSYLWAEGYIIRGPQAGTLTVAKIPYFPRRQEQSSQHVFEGPYPQ